jgi:hypothetical protein
VWSLPDIGEGANDAQSTCFQEYLDALVEGISGKNCVLSGCACTPQGSPDMTVAVAAGEVLTNGTFQPVSSGNVTIGAADSTNPRLDLIVANSSGTKAVRAGTASATPKPPARTANDVLLAVVYVPASDTTISGNQIVDLRVMREYLRGNPKGDDAEALGSTSLEWADVFVAAGAVINWQNGNVTITHSSGVLTIAGGTLVLKAGGTTSAPIKFNTGGSLMTTPDAGSMEMDANALYATTDAGNRGVVAVEHVIRADATRTFTSNTSVQAIFTTPANGTLTLETGVYEFECLVSMDTMSATTGNGKFSIAGTATLGGLIVLNMAIDAALDTLTALSGVATVSAATSAANAATTATATVFTAWYKGTFEVTGAGTIIPSFAQTTAAAAVVKIGSFFKCKRMGSTSMTSVGQWT